MTSQVRRIATVLLAAAFVQLPVVAAAQITAGHVNNFQDGTTQGWLINLLGQGNPPPAAIPQNIASGGPGGLNDRYLLLNSLGGQGAGSRLMVINPVSWGGNYLTAGITSIRMYANNLGSTDLHLRFLLEDPGAGPPTNIAVSATPVFLAAGSGWQSVVFPLFGPDGLAAILGTVPDVMANTTIVRIFSDPDFTGTPDPIAATLGLDDITAASETVPEPSTFALFGLGVAVVLFARRRMMPR